MSPSVTRKTTTAFFVQAALSFGISLFAATIAIIYLPVGIWVRGFLALSLLYVVTSAFTLAKCVRDNQESTEAQLEKLIAERDPFRRPTGIPELDR